MLGVLAATFRFQPSELWAMDWDEMDFWLGQANRLAEEADDGT